MNDFENSLTNSVQGHAYMKRALQLSTFGGPRVSPNPFVGAVIVAGDRIIGEGYHRQFGGPHAEVNAIHSVSQSDVHLLKEATMYVTLEPCSHFGKTPPCADLIIKTGIPHVVVASEDPFLKNFESGIGRMKNAGITVETGLLRNEARQINRRFFTAHTLKRPFILLKWAQSADGFIAEQAGKSVAFSTKLTQTLMHRERAFYDAIMVGVNTVINDNPRLDCRLWPCRTPETRPIKVSFDSLRLTGSGFIENNGLLKKSKEESLKEFMERLYSESGITSLMVEGGKATIENFLRDGLFDELRIETSPLLLKQGIKAPAFHQYVLPHLFRKLPPHIYGQNVVNFFVKNY